MYAYLLHDLTEQPVQVVLHRPSVLRLEHEARPAAIPERLEQFDCSRHEGQDPAFAKLGRMKSLVPDSYHTSTHVNVLPFQGHQLTTAHAS